MTDSRKRAKTLADNRISHHPIEALLKNLGPFRTSCYCRAELKFDFSTAVARRLKPSRATRQ